MKHRKFFLYLSLTVFFLTLYLLISGSPVLTWPLDKNNSIPLGTFITWLGFISLPMAIFLGVEKLRTPTGNFYRVLSNLLKISLLFALLWVPLSYILAGNISFSFSEKTEFQGGQEAMKWFWRYSYGIVLLPLIIIATHIFAFLLKLIKTKKTK